MRYLSLFLILLAVGCRTPQERAQRHLAKAVGLDPSILTHTRDTVVGKDTIIRDTTILPGQIVNHLLRDTIRVSKTLTIYRKGKDSLTIHQSPDTITKEIPVKVWVKVTCPPQLQPTKTILVKGFLYWFGLTTLILGGLGLLYYIYRSFGAILYFIVEKIRK